jgi:hypothetical protein
MNHNRLIWIGLFVSASLAPAFAAPALEKTDLHSHLANHCRDVALDHWSHPTADVLKKAGVAISKLQLCNGGKYPIFTVRFKFDPNGQTADFFEPLYANMAVANGFWPFSFVDLEDDTIVNVGANRKRELKISFEDFQEDPSAAPDSGSK